MTVCLPISTSSLIFILLQLVAPQVFSLAVFLRFFHFILSKERIFPEQVKLKVLFLNNFAGKCQCSRSEVYSLSPYLPMLNFLMALQVSQQHILRFCREGGKWKFIYFPFKHTMDLSSSPPPFSLHLHLRQLSCMVSLLDLTAPLKKDDSIEGHDKCKVLWYGKSDCNIMFVSLLDE